MHFREIKPDEFEHVYEMGYKEWTKGRTYEQYVKENQKEEKNGSRFVLADDTDKIIGSLIVITFRIRLFDQTLPLYGLGSVAIEQEERGKGYGKRLLEECLAAFGKSDNSIFMLYSDIHPSFYHPFHFKELPHHLQRYEKSICMVRAQDPIYHAICQLPVTQLPAYF
ncbi:GNAT family N-acetyltransferase [Ammoniphilus sp. 3BR4]|uniref:GNAT family N-acetyltransferase n=1 Tax=Ammoniphilus sp. 3BR4 TaxID=3158265 RepID=UPI003466D43B